MFEKARRRGVGVLEDEVEFLSGFEPFVELDCGGTASELDGRYEDRHQIERTSRTDVRMVKTMQDIHLFINHPLVPLHRPVRVHKTSSASSPGVSTKTTRQAARTSS